MDDDVIIAQLVRGYEAWVASGRSPEELIEAAGLTYDRTNLRRKLYGDDRADRRGTRVAMSTREMCAYARVLGVTVAYVPSDTAAA